MSVKEEERGLMTFSVLQCYRDQACKGGRRLVVDFCAASALCKLCLLPTLVLRECRKSVTIPKLSLHQ